jgi:hypothetical protein
LRTHNKKELAFGNFDSPRSIALVCEDRLLPARVKPI